MKNRYFSEPVFTCPLSPVTAICLLKFYLSNIKVSHSIATVSHSITTVSISIATVFHSIANVSLYSIATVSHFNTKVSLTITTVSFLSILSLTTIVSLSIATFSLYVTTVSHSIANVSLSSIATASQSITTVSISMATVSISIATVSTCSSELFCLLFHFLIITTNNFCSRNVGTINITRSQLTRLSA